MYLHPGEWFWGDNAHIRTVLGSCVAVSFWHARTHVGGLCHYLLPERPRPAASDVPPDPRYGPDVVGMMAAKARQLGPPESFTVKVFGGGSISQGPTGTRVGERNVEVATSELKRLGYTVAAIDVGGPLSRHLVFDLASGDVWLKRVECVPPITTRTR